MNDDQRLATNLPGRRDMTTTYRRPAGLAVLVAAAAIGLAACTSGSDNPQVATLPTNSHSGSAATGSSATATAGPMGNVTQLLNEWTACMRRLGDTSQQTPTVDANKVIHVIDPANYSAMGLGGQGGTNSCSTYMNAASKALGGGKTGGQPSSHLAGEDKFAECMRAHGIADFPDPGSNGQINMPADSGTPAYMAASKTCQTQVGMNSSAIAQAPGSVEQSNG
jgi:hypothetical protein